MGLPALTGEARTARIQELKALIRENRHAYYNETPIVPDDTYDAWVDELDELEVGAPEVVAVGAPIPEDSEWKKAAHGYMMGSLDKVNNLEGLTNWLLTLRKLNPDIRENEPVLVTEKLDGISIDLKYVKGAFSQAITRGDGVIGEDISVNVAKMRGVKARIDKNFTGPIRAEIVVTKSAFKEHFADCPKPYRSLRSAAGGIARRYDGWGSEHLTVMVYRVVEGRDFETEGKQFEWLTEQGFLVPNWFVTAMMPGVRTPHDLWVEYQQSRRAELDYVIDGLVVSIDDLLTQGLLGDKDSCPVGSVAFKFAPVTRETILRKIEWQVGGTGRITPVAMFDAVGLLGATVTYASLYNIQYIRDLGLDVGAKIIVARANDVIPRVVSVRAGTGTVASPPDKCPVCGSDLQMEGKYLVCPNSESCPAQAVGRVQRYVKGVDIKDLGTILIERLVEDELVKTPADLYRLTVDDLAGVERMGEKSAQTVHKNLWAKNPIALDVLLGSLSIPGIASATIQMVMTAGYDTWEAIQGASEGAFGKVPGLGPVKAKSLSAWLSGPGKPLMDELLGAGVKIKGKVVGKLTGKSFCFTGTMKHYKREELAEMVVEAGGVVKDRVGKGLTFLVLADATSGSTKAQAAKKHGTTCISEDEFLRMING